MGSLAYTLTDMWVMTAGTPNKITPQRPFKEPETPLQAEELRLTGTSLTIWSPRTLGQRPHHLLTQTPPPGQHLHLLGPGGTLVNAQGLYFKIKRG